MPENASANDIRRTGCAIRGYRNETAVCAIVSVTRLRRRSAGSSSGYRLVKYRIRCSSPDTENTQKKR